MMLTLVVFAFYVYFISLKPVMPESAEPRNVTNTLGNRQPTKDDFGLESVSVELPILDPEAPPAFKSQVRYRTPMPQPKRPGIPQVNAKPNLKPAPKFPIPQAMGPKLPRRPAIPQANMNPAAKFPIPRAIGPEIPKMPVGEEEPHNIKAAKAPPRAVLKAHKPPPDEEVYLKHALRHTNEKTNREIKYKTLDLMEQCLYHTQDGNLLTVEELAKKYGMTKRYRMAFVVLKMEELKNEMYQMYSYLYKNLQHYRSQPKQYKLIKFVNQIIYYTHLLKKNIDITYAVEYLIEHFSEL